MQTQNGAFDRVAAIVNQEDQWLQIMTQNRRKFLCRELKRAITYQQNMPSLGCGLCEIYR
jgi:hypothetical protein